jgi:hypothetical protein
VSNIRGPGETGAGEDYQVLFLGQGAPNFQFKLREDISQCCTIVNSFPLEENKVHTYALHYKGTNGNNELDIYVNGLRAAGYSLTNHPDFGTRGPWKMNAIQLGGGNPHVSLQTGDYVVTSSAVFTDTIRLSVLTETGETYGTEASINLLTDTFSEASGGRVEGNGSTQNLYRVIDGTEGYFRAVELPSE